MRSAIEGDGSWAARVVFRLGLIMLLWAASLGAQDVDTRAERLQKLRQAKSQQLQPPKRSGLESMLFELKDRRVMERYQAGYRGFHPMLGGFATGSGFALGAQFRKADIARGALNFQTGAQASFAGYQRYQLGLSAPAIAKSRIFVAFNFNQNNFPQEDFFGIGSDSPSEKRTSYRLETTEYSGSVGFRPIRKLELGGRGAIFNTNVGHGTDVRFPSTEELFEPDTTPGLDAQPHYKYAGAFAKYDVRDQPLNPRSGGLYQIEGGYYGDRSLESYSFRRWSMEAQQYIPFFNERRVIAVRGKLELTNANSDQEVPFFLMPTLGGSEDLRRYSEFRLRDRNSVVFNLEYRWEAFSGLDLALFGDAGNVFKDADDIRLDKLKTAYGFGFRFNTAQSVFLRIDLGFSPEGMRPFVKFNHVF
jgi:outer membrane protein assembly factor BamA